MSPKARTTRTSSSPSPCRFSAKAAENTVIDASGLLNGINIDGYNNAGLAHVIVSGFTVQNANAQGILVTNATDVTISNNHVTGNDRVSDIWPVRPECPAPGFPVYFLAGEGFDCGEAIHLSGVDHSIVANNLVDQNAGGILLSDDTGQTHDNLISGNVVRRQSLRLRHHAGFAQHAGLLHSSSSGRLPQPDHRQYVCLRTG